MSEHMSDGEVAEDSATWTTSLEQVRAGDIKPTNYQRSLRPTLAKMIAKKFNALIVKQVLVSLRQDGCYYVIDGQHRVRGVIEALGPDYPVDCVVYLGLTIEQEVELFLSQRPELQKHVNAIDILHAEFEGGAELAVSIVRTVGRAGLEMDWTGGKSIGAIKAAAQVKTIYKAHGSARLLEVLLLLRDTFGERQTVFQAEMLSGMSGFLDRYSDDPHYVRSEFVRKLGKFGSEEVLQRARSLLAGLGRRPGGNSLYTGYAMWVLYNERRRNGTLAEWQWRMGATSQKG